jgi:hypothetical protein
VSDRGGHPTLSLTFKDNTIAASFGGTAAATVLNSSISCAYARAVSIYNYTKRDLELIFGPDPTTNAYGSIFVPGDTTAHMTNGYLVQQPISVSQGTRIIARTMADTAITVSSALFLRLDFWA